MDSNSIKQRSRRTREEAAEWFVELREGSVDASDRHAFSAWLRSSPENIQAFLEIAALWMDVPVAVDATSIDVEALIAYVGNEATTEPVRAWYKYAFGSFFFWFIFGPAWSMVFFRRGAA